MLGNVVPQPRALQKQKEFAFDMLSKYPELENPETIQRWCRVWQRGSCQQRHDRASTIMKWTT